MDVLMPRLSDSMEEGVIISWLVESGAEVTRGDEIVEIETDKATMTYEADGAGIVQIVANEGDSLPVGALIAQILAQGESPTAGNDGNANGGPVSDDSGGAGDSLLSPSSPPHTTVTSLETRASAPAGVRVKASPLARRIAKAKSVDLHALAGSGPGGRIVKLDVERAVASGGTGKRDGARGGKPDPDREVVEPSRLQQTVAKRMTESKSTIPHFYLTTEVDMSRCHEARKRLKESSPEGFVVPSFNDMVVKASALALREFPMANARYRDGRFEMNEAINVGVAVAAQDALVVPVVAGADRAGLREIAGRVRELAERVRDGSFTPADISGGTFSVSNLGMYGVTEFDAVINPGQAAILAVGAIVDRPVVRDGEVAPGKVMNMTLSCDHRILYGSEGAEFLARIKALLEEPIGLAL